MISVGELLVCFFQLFLKTEMCLFYETEDFKLVETKNSVQTLIFTTFLERCCERFTYLLCKHFSCSKLNKSSNENHP